MKQVATKPRNRIRRPDKAVQTGQSTMEYVVVCAALALALGVGMRGGNDSVLLELLDAFRTAYEKFSYAISLPD